MIFESTQHVSGKWLPKTCWANQRSIKSLLLHLVGHLYYSPTEQPLLLLISWCSRPSTVQVFVPVIFHLCLYLWCCWHFNLVIVLHAFHTVLSEFPTLVFPPSGVPDNCGGTFPHVLCSVVLKPLLVAWKPGEYFCHVSRVCMLRQSKQGTMCLTPFWCVQSCSRTSELLIYVLHSVCTLYLSTVSLNRNVLSFRW